ncbi:MAG: alpha/beta hydrolase, partial [Planctomycetota bacterium]
LLDPIMTTWDADWSGSFASALSDMRTDPRLPPLATDAELRGLRPPTLVMAGDRDICFPGRAVIDRVRRLVPGVQTELLIDCKHCPPTTRDFRAWLAERLTRFVL